MDGVTILQFIFAICILGVGFYLLRLYHVMKLEKRLAPFSITSKKQQEKSLFDTLEIVMWRLVRIISKIISKSQVLVNYGKKYNKFIIYEDRDSKEGIDYVAMKILIALFVFILCLFSLSFGKVHFDFMFFLIIFIVSFFLPDVFLNISFYTKRKKIENDLLKAIIIMNNAFSSGRNIMQAIEIVKSELDGPIQDEFKKIYLDITYGLSLDVVFNRFYDRVRIEDAKYITTSLALLNKTGGDIVKVFSMIEKSIFDKKNLKNELDSLTASSRFVFRLLVILPFVFVLIIFVLNPSYFNPLFTTPIGIVVLGLTVLLYILYILIIRKVLKVSL